MGALRNFYVRKISDVNPSLLQTINYEFPKRSIEITITTNEFTCVCPWSGLPDFATITIKYLPDKKCIELKSLKYYLQSYRNVGIVHESVVNRILQDLVKVCKPKKMYIEAEFNIRGGLKTKVTASYNSRSHKIISDNRD
ncbi:MAG: preQ(1) synthase [Elusimicrobiota bacterium]|nr:preQ(1) synthase [Elusimicrobiota bacterium]